MIRKTITDKAEGIVVVPLWPTQPWFPIFKSLCSDMLILGTNNNVLLSVPNRLLQYNNPSSREIIRAALSRRSIPASALDIMCASLDNDISDIR